MSSRCRAYAPHRQAIELYWLDDGYHGGGYEATAATVTPRYWKITGPGYAWIFSGVALLIDAALWSLAALVIGVVRRRRRTR